MRDVRAARGESFRIERLADQERVEPDNALSACEQRLGETIEPAVGPAQVRLTMGADDHGQAAVRLHRLQPDYGNLLTHSFAADDPVARREVLSSYLAQLMRGDLGGRRALQTDADRENPQELRTVDLPAGSILR